MICVIGCIHLNFSRCIIAALEAVTWFIFLFVQLKAKEYTKLVSCVNIGLVITQQLTPLSGHFVLTNNSYHICSTSYMTTHGCPPCTISVCKS